VRLVEHVSDVAALDLPSDTPVALLAQTTLSQHDWRDVMDAAVAQFPEVWLPSRSDLCFATTNRQDALSDIAHRADSVIVIGSANSSNTVALEKVARANGCARVIRVNGADEIPSDLEGVVGVTAGASAPEDLVEAVIARLDPARGVEVVTVTTEEEYFPPPPELRRLLEGMLQALCTAFGAPAPSRGLLANDRAVAASQVLAGLAP
jgi:4-hydroxy-3-methylbut-2-enyl diphosphate reductase